MKKSIIAISMLVVGWGCETKTTITKTCGDGFLDPGEECDSTIGDHTCASLGHYNMLGTLTCGSDCLFDRSGCGGRCGDDAVNATDGEECDGIFLSGQTCQSLGFGGGTLTCDADCTFNTDGCSNSCGNGYVEGEEQCDDSNPNDNDGCSSTCQIEAGWDCVDSNPSLCSPICQNGLASGSEECDQDDLRNQTCLSLGYYGGVLTCTTNCELDLSSCELAGRCGDGSIQEDDGEVCDGSNLNGQSCELLGYYGGQLACGADCSSYDISNCISAGRCGDATVQVGHEDCDGFNLNGNSCQSLGYYGGTLFCTQDCRYFAENCLAFGSCGDGTIQTNFGEVCDGEDLNAQSCVSLGYHPGTLACSGNCSFDTTACDGICGDGVLQSSFEQCDGGNLDGQDCELQGRYPGTLSCGTNCNFNFDNCGGYCGDGVRQSSYEECDGQLPLGTNCISRQKFFGTPACSGLCGLADGTCRTTDLSGTSEFDYGYAIALDANYNVYVTGAASSSLDGQSFFGNTDIVLIKYDRNGAKVWTRQWGTSALDTGYGVSVDSSGNVFVAGRTAGALDGQTAAGNFDIFLTKYNADGSKLWTRQWGTTDEDTAYGVAVDSSGNAYVTGMTRGALNGQTSAGNADIFLTKYDSNGTHQWTIQQGTASADYGRAVAVNLGTGYVVITGEVWGSLHSQTWGGGNDVFVTKYSPSGNRSWTKQFSSGGTNNEYARGISHTGNHVTIVGYSYGAMPGLTKIGGSDVILLRLFDSDGGLVLTRQYGTTADDNAYGLVADLFGWNFYVTGKTAGALDGNPHAGGEDIFLTKFDSSGNKLWSRQWGTSGNEVGNGIATDSTSGTTGNLFIVGTTNGNLNGRTNSGSSDIFHLFQPYIP